MVPLQFNDSRPLPKKKKKKKKRSLNFPRQPITKLMTCQTLNGCATTLLIQISQSDSYWRARPQQQSFAFANSHTKKENKKENDTIPAGKPAARDRSYLWPFLKVSNANQVFFLSSRHSFRQQSYSFSWRTRDKKPAHLSEDTSWQECRRWTLTGHSLPYTGTHWWYIAECTAVVLVGHTLAHMLCHTS